MMELTVSADHRVADGATVARFLADLKTLWKIRTCSSEESAGPFRFTGNHGTSSKHQPKGDRRLAL